MRASQDLGLLAVGITFMLGFPAYGQLQTTGKCQYTDCARLIPCSVSTILEDQRAQWSIIHNAAGRPTQGLNCDTVRAFVMQASDQASAQRSIIETYCPAYLSSADQMDEAAQQYAAMATEEHCIGDSSATPSQEPSTKPSHAPSPAPTPAPSTAPAITMAHDAESPPPLPGSSPSPPPSPPTLPPPSGLSDSDKITIACSLGVGLPALLVALLAWCCPISQGTGLSRLLCGASKEPHTLRLRREVELGDGPMVKYAPGPPKGI